MPPDIGSQIHVGSAIFFTIMIWFRFYYAEKSGKNMVESSIDNDNSSDSRAVAVVITELLILLSFFLQSSSF